MCFKKNITTYEKVELKISTMRGSAIYEISNEGTISEISVYRIVYGNGSAERVLEKNVAADTAAVVEKLNEVDLFRWNGFSGKHPKNVTDGVMFDLKTIVNDGITIRADGSENFPKGYRELVRWLYEITR